jgi:Tfp pilus assembly protein PilN
MSTYENIWLPKKSVLVFLDFGQKEGPLSAVKITKKDFANKAVDNVERFERMEEIVNHFGKSTPYYIHVSGSGVLTRKIGYNSSFKEDLVISGDPDDFLFTNYNDGQDLVSSFFRKNLIDEFIIQLTEQKVHLLGISSGIVPLFALLEEETISADFIIGKCDNRISAFVRNDRKEDQIMWRNNFFDQKQLLALAIFRLITIKEDTFESSIDADFQIKREEFKQFRQFRFYGMAGLGAVFLSLVINYFYQGHLNNEIAQLEMELSISNENLALLERLEQEKMRKEQLVLSAGVNANKFLTYYLDQIGESIPDAIKLGSLELFPVNGKLKNKQKVEVSQDRLVIVGTTGGNEVLDDWIEKVNRYEWVKSVELTNYLKSQDGRADFNLLITVEN